MMNITEFLQKYPGLFAVTIGVSLILFTVTVMSATIDRGAATVLNIGTLTSGSFYAWIGSLMFLYFVCYLLVNTNTLYNNYLFLLYIVLLTFIMIHGSIYLSLNQVHVP